MSRPSSFYRKRKAAPRFLLRSRLIPRFRPFQLYASLSQSILEVMKRAAILSYFRWRQFMLQAISNELTTHFTNIPLCGVKTIATVRDMRRTDIFTSCE
jgi:hypothetical protein